METENQKSHVHVHFNIHPKDSNRHVCTNHLVNVWALYIFDTATEILTLKHLKCYSTYIQ